MFTGHGTAGYVPLRVFDIAPFLVYLFSHECSVRSLKLLGIAVNITTDSPNDAGIDALGLYGADSVPGMKGDLVIFLFHFFLL